ncbi:MAG: hypothetical protein ACI9DC_004605, partial [Gammaproteobacteria bacterium]
RLRKWLFTAGFNRIQFEKKAKFPGEASVQFPGVFVLVHSILHRHGGYDYG